MKKYVTILIALLLVAVPILTSCSPAAEVTQAPAADDTITVGIVLKSFSNPFWMMAKTAAEKKAAELGVEVVILGTTEEGDYNQQVAHIEDLTTRGVDVIVVVPAEASALVPAVEAAVEAGIPVINLDSPIETDKVSAFIGSDNVEGGRMAGNFIAEQLGGKGKVAVMRGRLGNPVETQRYEGFMEAVKAFPDIEVVAEGVANWEADQGYTVMEDFLTAHPEIQAVFAEADRMALGASQAAKAANREDIIIVGLDGIVEALAAVKYGDLAADVAQRPDLMGEYAVQYGAELVKTGKIEKTITTPMTLAVPDNVDPLIANWEAVGLSAPAPEGEEPQSTEGDYTIGLVLKSFSNPFWMMTKTAAEEKAEELGVEVIVLGTTEEGDYNQQVAHIEDLTTRGVDLIVVVPAEASALVPAVEAAVEAGIPVINLDSPIETDKVISYIGSDNVEGGRMAGNFIAEQLDGKGKVGVIRGRLGNPVELQRYEGFMEIMEKYPDIEVVAEGVANWEADQGYTVMEDFLTANPDIQAVFAEADRMALGASQAAAAAGEEDIIIVGLDGIVEALRAVQDGDLAADVAQRPDLMGEFAVQYGLEYLQTGKIEPVLTTPMTLGVPDNVLPLIQAWEELGF
ncbi:MAG TPA: sugar ABC transporter substrate-binding protein [Anaerolineales bacterium]|nr:sugar ABC transporter substrate-binding protein [Anaerolineales bacterium]